MKKLALVSIFAAALMLTAMVLPSALAQQPPVDTSTMYVGTIGWGPRRADPVRAYDTGSGELIFNVYDTLIFFKGEAYWDFAPVLATNVPSKDEGTIVTLTKTRSSTDVNVTNPVGSTWSDGAKCIHWVDQDASGALSASDTLSFVEPDGKYATWQVTSFDKATGTVQLVREKWIFHIRTTDANGNPIHFVDEAGNIVDNFDVYDAEYSIKRGLVQDQIGSPMWMFYKPLFGEMSSDFAASNTTEPTAMSLAHLIDDAVVVNGSDLIIYLGVIFPEIAFKQILSQTWASMVSKEFSISIGCWNGDLYTDSNGDGYPDWWTTVRRVARSPYDTKGAYRYVGTGPYRVTKFDSVNYVVELTKNDYYWGGWSGKHLNKIVIKYIADWGTRKNAFLAGEVDVCAVPRANMFELLDKTTGEPTTPGIITIKKISPTLSMDAMHFTFTVDPKSEYVAKRGDTGEVLPNFFNDTHVRRAFCYAFDYNKYASDAYYGECTYRKNMLIYGLVPDYYDPTVPGYGADPAKAEAELKAAMLPDKKSIWDTGFTLKLAYNTGNDQRRIAAEMLRDFFASLSTYDGRTGPAFSITVVEIDWDTYLDMMEAYQLPIWNIGWLADFADADNFARPYMHSYGDFAYFQNYTADNGWGTLKDELIDHALLTPDGPDRASLYKQLQQIYYNDAPSCPLTIPTGRRWCWYWVKGWYYNALYPAQYYYSMYKEDTCWFNISGPTPGVPDDVTNMRDVTYLILHFNAKAPEPGKAPDPRWVGTYGVGGVDPYGDRICNMRDITFTILHFNHRNQP